MKKIFFYFFIILFLMPICALAKSSSYIVMDINSGRVLSNSNEHNKQLIASITKIMTCIIVLENNDLNKEVTVGEEILEMYGTNIYIEVGEKMTVKDLLYGLMLRSGNDAAVTLAVNTFGSEEAFVKKMNEKAKLLGMNDTTFSNCHGLDDKTENYSTAYDMAILGRYAYENTLYKEIIGTKHYRAKSSLKSYDWYNRVSLLSSYKNCIGGKNGYTPAAGKTLVSYAKNDDMTLMVVSLNDSDIYNHHKNIYIDMFDKYKNYLIIDKRDFYIDKSLTSGRTLYINKSFYFPLKESELGNIKTLVTLNSDSSKNVGKAEIYLSKELIGSIPIYEEKKEDKKSSWFDKIKNWLSGKN